MRYLLPLLFCIPLVLPGQYGVGTGPANRLYQMSCASCHGADMDGGLGGSLVDDVWNHGSSDEDIARVIREGIPDMGMQAYAEVFSEEQIRSLVILIRERGRIARENEIERQALPQEGRFSSSLHDFQLEKVAEQPGILWGIDALPDGRFLVTEKSGSLWILDGRDWRGPVKGIPKVWNRGQGGLMEVAVHPRYTENGWIYLAFSEKGRGGGMTAIVRGRLNGLRWTNEEEIFRVPPKMNLNTGFHFGTRIVFQDEYLFFSIGDRGRQDLAQELDNPCGKVHRIHEDGRIPDDNPFVDTPGAFPSIWSYGNRNPQGLAAHPETGDLWESEHGPRGGDEINRILPGRNYGWPVITHGMNYNGTPLTAFTAMEGMEQPAHFWTPSIAVCGIAFYSGSVFPRWSGDLFAGGLVTEQLHRLRIREGRVVEDEIIIVGQGRVRDVFNGPDGHLYLLLENRSTKRAGVYRLNAASGTN